MCRRAFFLKTLLKLFYSHTWCDCGRVQTCLGKQKPRSRCLWQASQLFFVAAWIDWKCVSMSEGDTPWLNNSSYLKASRLHRLGSWLGETSSTFSVFQSERKRKTVLALVRSIRCRLGAEKKAFSEKFLSTTMVFQRCSTIVYRKYSCTK